MLAVCHTFNEVHKWIYPREVTFTCDTTRLNKSMRCWLPVSSDRSDQIISPNITHNCTIMVKDVLLNKFSPISKFNLNGMILKPLSENKNKIYKKEIKALDFSNSMSSSWDLVICCSSAVWHIYSCTVGGKGRKKSVYLLSWWHLNGHQILLTICTCNYWYSFLN